MAILLGGGWILGVAIPGIAVTAFCARLSRGGDIGAFLSAGAFGTLSAFTPLSGQKVADLLLLGLWLAAIWGWLLGGRRRAAWIWPGIVVLCFYIALTAAEIVAAPTHHDRLPILPRVDLVRRPSHCWPTRRGPTPRGGGCCGPQWPRLRSSRPTRPSAGRSAGGEEHEQARQIANNFLDGSCPVGSFSTSKELAAWVAMTTPFAAGLAMAARGRLRLMAVAATALQWSRCWRPTCARAQARLCPASSRRSFLYQLSQTFPGAVGRRWRSSSPWWRREGPARSR